MEDTPNTLTIPRPTDPIDAAVAFFGSPTKLAEAIGLSQSAITNWRTRQSMSYRAARAIEEATRGQVTITDLKPYIHRLSRQQTEV